MSIQYGSTPITDIKYCAPQGTLKNVSYVISNNSSIWGNEIVANYLTFTSAQLNASVNVSYASGSDVMFRKNFGVWESCPSNTTIPIHNIGDTVQLRGIGMTTNLSNHFMFTGNVLASGSVTSVTDGFGGDENVTLTDGCYKNMFTNCLSLRSAPQLIAKTLAPNCYDSMFSISGISKSPLLVASSVAYRCYRRMFWGSGVNEIYTNQTSFDNSSCTGWLSNTSANGTFHCSSLLASKIPEGGSDSTVPGTWTVIEDIN